MVTLGDFGDSLPSEFLSILFQTSNIVLLILDIAVDFAETGDIWSLLLCQTGEGWCADDRDVNNLCNRSLQLGLAAPGRWVRDDALQLIIHLANLIPLCRAQEKDTLRKWCGELSCAVHITNRHFVRETNFLLFLHNRTFLWVLLLRLELSDSFLYSTELLVPFLLLLSREDNGPTTYIFFFK